jgi:ribosomal protein S18 acetylase RimI-like enzyme
MNMTHRPYQGLKDFIAMTSILAIGRKTDTTAHYVHTGDLSWWMFYSDYGDSHWHTHITIWEYDGITYGWTLFDPNWCSFDVYVLPELRGSATEDRILDWSIDCLTKIVRVQDGTEIQTIWVAEHDDKRIQQLENRGFRRDKHLMWYLECRLESPIPEPHIPTGFGIRKVAGNDDIKQRAAAAHQAFGSKQSFDQYWSRYQHFVDSPVYDSSIDLVTVAPQGVFASFCIAWPDPVNHIGLFEPVGTHPNFQSQGLGKVVVTEGLRQLQNCGMQRAEVCVENSNQAALGLYQAVGFQKQYQLFTYVKTIMYELET